MQKNGFPSFYDQDVDGFGDVEEDILDVIDVEFPSEVEDHVEDCVENWHMYQ